MTLQIYTYQAGKISIFFRLLGTGRLENTHGLHQGHETQTHLVFKALL